MTCFGSMRWWMMVAALSLVVACGDESISDLDTTTDTGFADVADTSDVPSTPDATPDGTADTTPDAVPDVAPDGTPGDVAGDTVPDTTPDAGPEIVPDNTPPEVIATTPAAGEGDVAITAGFKVTVTFSEPISKNTIAPQTVKLFDFLGKEVASAITVSPDNVVVTITPNNPALFRASPYRLRLQGNVIADLAGNRLAEAYEMSFYTEGWPDMGPYEELAARYAPRVVADTTDGASRTRVPLAFNADGDWDGSNNQTWLQKDAAEITSAVYYTVTESYTHYFIHYMYIFPWAQVVDGQPSSSNAANGVMVTVEKAREAQAERPVAATLYWRTGVHETNHVFVTEESGIVGALGKAQYGDVTEVYPQATLFPDGHVANYISPLYESCLWIRDTDPGFGATCVLNDGVKALMKKLVFDHDAAGPTILSKEGGWPSDMSDFEDGEGNPVEALGYELVPALTELWARRNSVGDEGVVYSETLDYETDAGRPADGSVLPSRFVDTLAPTDAEFGRPYWAWRHEPANGKLFGIKPGWLGVDPAWYTCKRHGSAAADSAVPVCALSNSLTFSTAYCFNGLAAIDVRADNAFCQ